VTVGDLRDRPDFADDVADRVWRAFWKKDGHPPSLLTGLVQESFGEGPIPLALVAHDGDRFIGTVSVIVCDEDARPHYTPWIGALWVEPEHRRKGTGAALVDRACVFAFTAGAERVYLLSQAHRRHFYEGLGSSVLEENVPEEGMFIMSKDKPGGSTAP
jgi:GNAT superfamily N-acetyltransferase